MDQSDQKVWKKTKSEEKSPTFFMPGHNRKSGFETLELVYCVVLHELNHYFGKV